MRVSVVMTGLILSLGLSAVAQKAPFKVQSSDVDVKMKDSAVDEKPRSAPPPATGNPAKASKDLQTIEHETAKSGPASHPRKAGTGRLANPEKSESTPKINFTNSAMKGTGGGGQTVNDPLKGRIKQKGAYH